MEGWVKIHRGMLEWEWYGDTNVVRLFFHLLLKANYEDKRWQGNIVGRGQLVTGRVELAEQTGLTEQQVRTALSKLKSTGEITIKTTNKYSIITICNYARYQDTEQQYQPTEQPTNNQQITNKQPTNNQQTTTTKEIKKERNNIFTPLYSPIEESPKGELEFIGTFAPNIPAEAEFVSPSTPLQTEEEKEKSSAKKEKEAKHKYGEHQNVLLTDTEAGKLKAEYGADAPKIVQNFSELKAMKGYKYKSDYLAIRKWGASAYYESQSRIRNGNNLNQTDIERIVECGIAMAATH